MSIEEVWHEYQHWSTAHDASTHNIEDLRNIKSLELEDYAHNIELDDSNDDRLVCVRKRIRELIDENNDMILFCKKKMRKLSKQLKQHDIFVEHYHLHQEIQRADLKKNESWVQKCNSHLNNTRPCTVKKNGVVHKMEFGASGYRGIRDEDEPDEIDVLEEDDSLHEENIEACTKINYYNDKDDANDCDEAYKSDDIAITIGKSVVKPSFACILKPHQREGVIFALKELCNDERGIILAHAMGLGKTLTTIAILQALSKCFKVPKFLILCPKSTLIPTWYEELNRWNTHLTFKYYAPISDDKLDMIQVWAEQGGVLLMSHNRFRMHQLTHTFRFNPDVVVVDEAHNLKNERNQFYQAMKSLKTTRKLLLTGTPVQNNLMEYFTMLQLVRPGLIDEDDFKTNYQQAIDKGSMADADDDAILEAKTKIKVFARLTDGVVHRRSVAVLAHALPPMTDYKCVYTIPELPDTRGMKVFESTYAIAEASLTVKIHLMQKLVKQIRKTGDSTLIFSKSKHTVHEVSKALKCIHMTGEHTAQERENLVQSFMNGHSKEFVMTTQVGGFGLNLFKANRIIILDPMWNPTYDRQACFRAYRYGQVKEVFIYRFIVKDTIEERIYRCAIHKSLAACRIIDDQDVERIFTEDQLFARDDFDENILKHEDVQDNVLHKVFNEFTEIGQHDILFAEASHEKLSDEDLAYADNTYNEIIYCKDHRILTHPISQVQHTISMTDLYFPPNEDNDALCLVPPSVPVWKKNASSYTLKSFKPSCGRILYYILEQEFLKDQNSITTNIPYVNSLRPMICKNQDVSRVRLKIVADDTESEWSDWSAYMY